jgi:hypothetical protein
MNLDRNGLDSLCSVRARTLLLDRRVRSTFACRHTAWTVRELFLGRYCTHRGWQLDRVSNFAWAFTSHNEPAQSGSPHTVRRALETLFAAQAPGLSVLDDVHTTAILDAASAGQEMVGNKESFLWSKARSRHFVICKRK